MSENNKRYTRNSRVISGRLSDEMVMMDIDKGKYFSLNQVATRIWDLLEDEMTADELCDRLIEEYDVDAAICMEQVSGYLEEMESLGLLLITDDAS